MTDPADREPFSGDTPSFTLKDFARALQAVVAPDGIEVRVQEDEDGTRTAHAWQRDQPGDVAVFAIDDVRLGPYQADMVAHTIRRSFDPPA